jgi:hypothetical protein
MNILHLTSLPPKEGFFLKLINQTKEGTIAILIILPTLRAQELYKYTIPHQHLRR